MFFINLIDDKLGLCNNIRPLLQMFKLVIFWTDVGIHLNTLISKDTCSFPRDVHMHVLKAHVNTIVVIHECMIFQWKIMVDLRRSFECNTVLNFWSYFGNAETSSGIYGKAERTCSEVHNSIGFILRLSNACLMFIQRNGENFWLFIF